MLFERLTCVIRKSVVLGMGRILLLALVATPVSGATTQADRKTAASRKTASQVFWRYTKCIVRRNPQRVSELLAVTHWTSDQVEAAEKLATNNTTCLLVAGDELKMPASLFRGGMAAAAFVARHDTQPLPDYSAAPIRFGEAAVATAITSDMKNRALLLTFAECVVRNRAEDVRSLLEQEPHSKAETERWAHLNPILGDCVPAEPGTRLSFSRTILRGLLGEAAYELDEMLQIVSITNPVITPEAAPTAALPIAASE